MAMFFANDAGSHVVANTLTHMQRLLDEGDTDPFLANVALSALGVLKRADLVQLSPIQSAECTEPQQGTRLN